MITLTAVLLLLTEHAYEPVTSLAFGDLDIVLGVTVILHEGKEAILGNVELKTNQSVRIHKGTERATLRVTYELVFLAGDVGNVHVVGGRRQIFKLLASEDVESDHVDLGVTVLASLGGGHFNDLAGTVLNDNVAVLTQRRTLHGEGGRGASVGGLEGHLML